MIADNGSRRKSSLLWSVGLMLTGLLMCAGGVFIGTMLTTPRDTASDVTGREEHAIVSHNPAVLNENPQPESAATDVAAESFRAPGDDPSRTESAASVVNADTDAEPAVNRPSADPIAGHIALADEELRAGNYAKAMRTYRFALDHVAGSAAAAVQFRIALCFEASGSFHEANSSYQAVIRRFATSAWVSPARLGEARCLAAMGRIDSLSAGLLRQVLLDQTAFSPRIRGELLHLCGRACCQSFMPDGVVHLLDDDGMILPDLVTDPNRQLDLLSVFLKEEPLPARPSTFSILQQTDRLPDSIFLRAHTPASGLRSLLEAVTSRSGFACHISDAAALAIAGRTQQVYTDDISLSLLLDGLCAPFGLIWSHDADAINVAASAEVEPADLMSYRRSAGERLLNDALVLAPDSRQAGYSRVSLGILQFQRRSTIDAAYTFQMQMELDPRSEVEADAAFNLGKCYLATGQVEKARTAFLRAVDSAAHRFDARIGAYLYVGRLQIEEGQFQAAVSSMVRALALCRGSDLEPQVALLLASAYLMAGSPQGASSVLMERRDDFHDEMHRHSAAFVSALSRFQAAVLPAPKERAGRALVTALTRFRPRLQFGSHWSYLHAVACDDLGLTGEAIEGFTETIKRLPAAPLRDRAMIRLASQYRLDNRLDDAALLLAGVNAEPTNALGQQISLQAARVALDQGDGRSAVRHCRHVAVASENKQLQRAALQVMGRAYESQRNHRAAVYCFAGMLPADQDADDQDADDQDADDQDADDVPETERPDAVPSAAVDTGDSERRSR